MCRLINKYSVSEREGFLRDFSFLTLFFYFCNFLINNNINMKKIVIITICLFLNRFISMAQEPEVMFGYYPLGGIELTGVHAIEVGGNANYDEHCFLVAASEKTIPGYHNLTGCPSLILKISPEGNYLDELAIGYEGCHTLINKIFPAPGVSASYLAAGTVYDTVLQYSTPFLAQFNCDMNLEWKRKITLPDEYKMGFIEPSRVMMDSQGDIVFCIAPVQGSFQYYSNRLFIRTSPMGDLLALSSCEESSISEYGGLGDLFEFADGSGDYGQSAQNSNGNHIDRMNRNFELISQHPTLQSIALPQGTYWPTSNLTLDMNEASVIQQADGSFVIGVQTMESVYSRDGEANRHMEQTVMVLKLDKNDSIIGMTVVGSDNDSADFLARNHWLDEGGDGSFYFCNYQHGLYYWPLNDANRLAITKTDNNASIIWQRFYEDGENVYFPYSIIATNDGGCIVTGCAWKSDSHLDSHVFLFKVFSDGTLAIPEMEEFMRPYAYYPNPAQNELHLNYSPDVTPAQIELYDIQGWLVKTQRSGLESIRLQGLPAGTYTLRVTMEGGKVFSDKVVKE